MDKERRAKHKQGPHGGRDKEGAHDRHQAHEDHEQKSGWTSSSKFNRILGNLERSILGQFNQNTSNGNISRSHASGKSRSQITKQTSAKRKQAIQHSSVRNEASISNQAISEERASEREHKQAAAHQSTSRDRITAATNALKSTADAMLASEALGKLTLHECQQQPPQRQCQLFNAINSNQIFASNKLPIPPPHVNDEARSINKAMLFGSGAALAQHQSFETNNTDASASSASSTMNRSNKLAFERRQNESRYANRPNSSPASSAKSLPATAPKSESHPAKHSSAINKDDEESGFPTYQSRRSFLLNHHLQQQQQQQQAPQEDASNDKKMMLAHMNMPPTQLQGVATSRLYNPYLNGNLHQSQQQYLRNVQHQVPMQQQFNQQFQLNSRAPMPPPAPPPPPPLSYDRRYFPTGYNNLNLSAINSFNPNHYPSFQPLPPTSIHDSTNLSQVQRLQERYDIIDNCQQIYANAPPKPRRYQYYDLASIQGDGTQTASNPAGAALVKTIAPVQQNRSITYQRQQMPMNNHQAIAPMVSHQQKLANNSSNLSCINVPPSLYNKREGLTKQSLQHDNAISYAQQQQYLQQQQSRHLQYPYYPEVAVNGPTIYPMVKSKSSLDAGDLMRLRRNRLSNAVTNSQQNGQQPAFDYRSGGLIAAPQNLGAINSRHSFQPAPGGIQRSKSVTHLLPEFETQSSEPVYQDQDQHAGYRLAPVSSASTNHLNLAGQSQTRSVTLAPSHTMNVQAQQQHRHNQTQQQQLQPMVNQVNPSAVVNQLQGQPQLTNSRTDHQRQQDVLAGSHQLLSRARSLAALNHTQSAPNRAIMHSPGNSFMLQEPDGPVKPSLDDQIRHLLIDRTDNRLRDTTVSSAGLMRNNNAIYQTSSCNNGKSLVPSSSTNATITETQRTIPTWTREGVDNSNAHLISRQSQQANQQQHQSKSSSTGILTNDEYVNSRRVSANVTSTTHNPSQTTSAGTSIGGYSLAGGVIELNEMGNQQQRQYNVQQVGAEISSQRRQSDANSQLIVDLTTPRVLARTQTTLMALDNQPSPSQAYSINQVGLPQVHSASQNSTTQTGSTRPAQMGAVSQSYQANENNITTNCEPTPSQDVVLSDPVGESKTAVIERTAPYYYSDLKSEEQQRALMNIVHQKSLSPPPQLLSRSTDQSSTRLAPRSATLHSSHARTLSENLAQRQRQRVLEEAFNLKESGDSISAWAKRNRSSIKESSSTTNIAKNIDELFERPLLEQHSNMAAKTDATTAQSMLTLNECHQGHLPFRPAHPATNIESVSRGYRRAGELKRSKNLSKSKSLDNISQKPLTESLPSKFSVNPVYENIRRSNKLLTAINDAADCFSSASTWTDATKSKLAAASANSDESMDSILGSSLDESDSDSDIIDEIKISSTDNHLNDISDLIEQLKINHSKLTEEYKSTLVRISKTINSRSAQKSNSDKLTRRLHLLQLRSKRCESRSKNQLALIQMMEKVLRQSKMRALNAGSNSSAANRLSASVSNQPLASSNDSTAGESLPSFISNGDLASVAVVPAEAVKCSENHAGQEKQSAVLLERRKSSEADGATKPIESADAGYKLGVTATASTPTGEDKGESSSDAPKRATPPGKQSTASQEIIKAIVTEKEADPCAVQRSMASIKDSESQAEPVNVNDRQVINGLKAEGGISSKKNNAVTKRILDIEKRQSGCLQKQKSNEEQRAKNPFYSNGNSEDSVGSSKSDGASKAAQEAISKTTSHETARESSKSLRSSCFMRDEDDFIEFLSDDLGSHRSQFEASQFSASDFNTSTSASESSTSGVASDSMNSTLSNAGGGKQVNKSSEKPAWRDYQRDGDASRGQQNGSCASAGQQLAGGILKKASRRASFKENNGCSAASLQPAKSGKKGGGDRAAAIGQESSEKFKNVLGNVIDVDVCPTVSNMSQCSPVNNQA